MEYKERIREIMKALKVNQIGLASKLGVTQGIISEFASGAREPSKEFILGIYKLGISIDWFFSGNGEMFLAKSPNIAQQDIVNPGVVGMAINNANGSVENFGNVNMITDPFQVNQKGLPLYTIPLLTKEQVFQFDPNKEIPTPKAYSGDYPAMLVPIPIRFREYSTDLRATIVFNGLMAPLLNAGDIAIFQATWWHGNGVYVYRVNEDLHISYVRFDGSKRYVLTKEFKPEEEILYHTESFRIIGRVRAVVREIG
jgi:transcriptional regulator with XRE-family HTH domain